ncbi:MAG: SurA N-terminal domain-containing protein [Pseudomonadota bacterium]
MTSSRAISILPLSGKGVRWLASLSFAVLAFALVVGTGSPEKAEAASKIRALVNNEPVTSYDVARRRAFMRLRREKGNLRTKALEELIVETMRMQEAKRIRAIASSKEVDDAYARFAKSNRMSVRQLNGVLNQAGVTSRGFKRYIRAQMSWQRAVAARYRAEKGGSGSQSQSFTASLQATGKNATETKEYSLQQVIFVVPKSKRRSQLASRRREANNFRKRFVGCDKTMEFAKGLRDVTVRSLGRVLNPQLPPLWKKDIENAREGGTTRSKDTDRGVEFIAVCRVRSVKDAQAGQFNFQQDTGVKELQEIDKKYTAEIRKRAVVVRR